LKFVPLNFLKLISDDPDVEAICRESLYVVLSEVVTTVGEYNSTALYLKYGLAELGTKVKGVTILLRVGTNMMAQSCRKILENRSI
jgi:hypothetical protein